MNIREHPDYIPFLEALTLFVDLFPHDLILYGIMVSELEIPQSLQLHIRITHAEGTRAAWLKIFQWALDTYPFLEMKQRIHDALTRAGMILRYRVFIRDYQLDILRPELPGKTPPQNPFSCFSFLCTRK